MTIPPGEAEYPTINCPQCGRSYDLRELDVSNDNPPIYSCPHCKVKVYEPSKDNY